MTNGRHLGGQAASPGIAIGPSFLVKRGRVTVVTRRLAPGDVEEEVKRLVRAIEESHRQLDAIRDRIKRQHKDPGHILEAHQMILHDRQIVDGTIDIIRDEQVNAESALTRVLEHVRAVFEEIDRDDEGRAYLRERVDDVDHVGQRILRNLAGVDGKLRPPPGVIVVAHELSPADVVQLHRAGAIGFALEHGGRTSHTALMARTFEVPMVVGLEGAVDAIDSDEIVVLDGLTGELITEPTPELILKYQSQGQRYEQVEAELTKNRDLPAVTRDGHVVPLMANIEFADELATVIEHGGDGIGLYRTEYLFVDRAEMPGEEDHYLDAKAVLSKLGDRPVVFRTVDLGGEKSFAMFALPEQTNPALGLRSIRLAFREEHVLRAQLRGLLRASVHGRLKIMFPMISGVGELRRARRILDECRADLLAAGHPVAETIEIGVMIELPSSVMIADLLAKECDFFSIGSNDLIQFTLAIDRENEMVSDMYHPLHPAILRSLRFVTRVAHKEGIPVSLCGEMAAEPMLAVVLIGLDIDQLSMPAPAIPRIKNIIRKSGIEEARALVEELVVLPTIEDVEKRVRGFMVPRFLETSPLLGHRRAVSGEVPGVAWLDDFQPPSPKEDAP